MKTVYLPKIFQPFKCDDLVRIGKDNDGGYIISREDIDRCNYLISFGLGEDWSFEEEFCNGRNICTAYDGTLKDSIINSDNFIKFFTQNTYHKKDISLHSSEKYQSVEEAFKNKNKIFLKCDIDGAEYNILDSIIMHSHLLQGLVIEIHALNSNIANVLNFISKIKLNLVHIHINNYMYFYTEKMEYIPDVLELSFTSQEIPSIKIDNNLTLPLNIDQPNNPNDDEFRILFK